MKRYSPDLEMSRGTDGKPIYRLIMAELPCGNYVNIDDIWEWLLNTARLTEKQAREIAEDFCEELGIEPARKRFA